MNKMEDQKLIDICFQIGIVISDPEYKFHKKTREERATWIAQQLAACGYPTVPCGASWGVLTLELNHASVYAVQKPSTAKKVKKTKKEIK